MVPATEVCCCSMPKQHLRSYEGGNQFVVLGGYFMVAKHCDLICYTYMLCWYSANQALCLSNQCKAQCYVMTSINLISHWFGIRTPDLQLGKPALYRFVHSVQLLPMRQHCKYARTSAYCRRSVPILILQYSKTSLNRPTMGPTLNSPFTEMVSVGS